MHYKKRPVNDVPGMYPRLQPRWPVLTRVSIETHTIHTVLSDRHFNSRPCSTLNSQDQRFQDRRLVELEAQDQRRVSMLFGRRRDFSPPQECETAVDGGCGCSLGMARARVLCAGGTLCLVRATLAAGA